MTPRASDGPSAISQPVATPLTRAAIFLVVTINPGAGHRAAIRSSRARALRRISRTRRDPFLCRRVWVGCLGPAIREAAAKRSTQVSRDPGGRASCRLNTWRHALPYPGAANGLVFRAGNADYGKAWTCSQPPGRGAWVPLL